MHLQQNGNGTSVSQTQQSSDSDFENAASISGVCDGQQSDDSCAISEVSSIEWESAVTSSDQSDTGLHGGWSDSDESDSGNWEGPPRYL